MEKQLHFEYFCETFVTPCSLFYQGRELKYVSPDNLQTSFNSTSCIKDLYRVEVGLHGTVRFV